MKNSELTQFLGKEDISISYAMKAIDDNASGILFLVNNEMKLLGCITDGDIRRFLLAGGRMDDDAIKAANTNPKAARALDDAKGI